MRIAADPAEARALARELTHPLGFVPTMGALHAGHLSLVARARRECASIAVSIFVNPLQFGPHEDLERYPRPFARDIALLEEAGVALLYHPDVRAMYPSRFSTTVDVGKLGAILEGAARPGHFAGVATVMTKLMHVIEAEHVYMGQKDAQQTAVMRRLVADLEFPGEIVVCATVRESDGLAVSSRNVYLDAAQRAAAPGLHRALRAVADAIVAGADGEDALAAGRRWLVPPLREEYLAIVDPRTFEEPASLRPSLVVGAVRLGTTRLLDNVAVAARDGSDPILTPEPPARVGV